MPTTIRSFRMLMSEKTAPPNGCHLLVDIAGYLVNVASLRHNIINEGIVAKRNSFTAKSELDLRPLPGVQPAEEGVPRIQVAFPKRWLSAS